jgi:histidinol-phosphate aminotransferase
MIPSGGHDAIPAAHLWLSVKTAMSRFWSDVVKDLTPYVPGEQPKLANLVKLNTNENPYGPHPRYWQRFRAELGDDAAR